MGCCFLLQGIFPTQVSNLGLGKTEVIDKAVSNELIDKETKILVNPTGRFVIGGPLGDSGLTGRKIIVDTYHT